MGNVRRADLAGAWYPGTAKECLAAIETYSEKSLTCPGDGTAVGGIVPHAGWYFSGKIACNVIKCLKQDQEPDTCILFGRHLHAGGSNYIMTEGKWATPLGELAIDEDLARELASEFTFSIETADDYEPDNTIELQLPFIKYFFPDTRIVPLGTPPRASSLEIAKSAARISQRLGRKTIVFGSTDLTHYGANYGYAPEGMGEDSVQWVKNVNDKRMVDLMVKMEAGEVIRESLENHNACCGGAVGSAITAARELGARRAEKIIYSTSYDIRPDTSFVGYVGVIFLT